MGKAAKRGDARRVQIMPEKRDLARSALRFGALGGCGAGCELCRFLWLCDGGEIGADALGGEDEREGNPEGERAT